MRLDLPWPLAPIYFPIADWLMDYDKETLLYDFTAGLTVFVFLIPQGMAYALLAGMPAIYGLYASTVPLFVYAVFGTSRQISIGPMAIGCLLIGVSAQQLGYEEQSNAYIAAVMNISMLVGVIAFLLGIFRMGALVNLLSQSVLTGFITASALVISLNQIKYLLGIKVPRFAYTAETIVYLLSHLQESNLNDVAMSTVVLAILYGVKRWTQKNKPTADRLKSYLFRTKILLSRMSALLMIILGSIIAKLALDSGSKIDVIGDVPAGLKAPFVYEMDLTQSINFIPSALGIAFVTFAGNWAVATRYAKINRYEVDATQEMLALGITVIIGAMFNSFATSGGLARSSVNADSGAKTQLASILVGILMLLAIQFFTPLFYYIPMNVLGSIIEISVISMMDFDQMIAAYSTHKRDCIVMVVTFLFTFFIGVSEGLFVGIFISISMIIYKTAFPAIVTLGKLPALEGGYYKDVTRYETADQIPSVAIIRMDAALFFVNSVYFKEIAKRAAAGEFHSSSAPIRKLVIDASAWTDIDLAGVTALFEIKEEVLCTYGVSVDIACTKGCLRDKLQECKFYNQNCDVHYHNMSIDDAIFGCNNNNNSTSADNFISPVTTTSSPSSSSSTHSEIEMTSSLSSKASEIKHSESRQKDTSPLLLLSTIGTAAVSAATVMYRQQSVNKSHWQQVTGSSNDITCSSITTNGEVENPLHTVIDDDDTTNV